jgi:alpha-tubulin suppressor-like RCC1 family protein
MRLHRLAVVAAALLLVGCRIEGVTRQKTLPVLWTAVVAGRSHSCGIDTDGVAWCWGSNDAAQLGAGPTTPLSVGLPPLRVVGGIAFKQLTAGWYHTCGLAADGRAYCWGQNIDGRVGVDPATGPEFCPSLACSSSPVAVGGELRFASISAGGFHTCGVTTDGAVYCWGQDVLGQLGDGGSGSGVASSAPVRALADVAFTAVSAGYRHTCALAVDGSVYCWGRGDVGQAGTPSGDCAVDSAATILVACSPAPVRLSGDVAFQAVDAGNSVSCGLGVDGRAYCWGSNQYAGLGTTAVTETCGASPGLPCSHVPLAVSGGRSFVGLSVGAGHACGLTDTGDTWCWGDNQTGELGDCDVSSWSVEPQLVCGKHQWAWVAGGAFHSCGVDTNGAGYCWGSNGEGQLGWGSLGFDYFGPGEIEVWAPLGS